MQYGQRRRIQGSEYQQQANSFNCMCGLQPCPVPLRTPAAVAPLGQGQTRRGDVCIAHVAPHLPHESCMNAWSTWCLACLMTHGHAWSTWCLACLMPHGHAWSTWCLACLIPHGHAWSTWCLACLMPHGHAWSTWCLACLMTHGHAWYTWCLACPFCLMSRAYMGCIPLDTLRCRLVIAV